MDKFLLEKDGQIDFYNRFLMRVNPALSLDDILADNNDGVLNGNLLEFKLHISDLNAVLFQSIKYLSALRKEKTILKQWDVVLDEAKKTKEYNPLVTYGVYQIAVEIDTSYKDETTGNTIYNNVELHTALVGLKNLVKDYYNQEIVPTLFEYEFLK